MDEFDDTLMNISEPTNEELLSVNIDLNYGNFDEEPDFNNDDNLMPKLRHYQFDHHG